MHLITALKTSLKAYLLRNFDRESQQHKPNVLKLHVSRTEAKYAQRADIEDLRPHDLRHRFGYRMAEQVPLHRLAQIMGHDSLDTTTIYIQGTPQDLQQAVESIAWE